MPNFEELAADGLTYTKLPHKELKSRLIQVINKCDERIVTDWMAG